MYANSRVAVLGPAHAMPICVLRGRNGRERGFSLLEVLVAFVILALVATALFRLFSGALGNMGAAEEYSRAALIAESVLAEAAATQPLREGSTTGAAEGGRYAWTAKVTPFTPSGANPDLERASESMPTRLYRVEVDLRFPGAAGGERRLLLATTRIGAKGAP
jgi:general secretion pathway protein I